MFRKLLAIVVALGVLTGSAHGLSGPRRVLLFGKAAKIGPSFQGPGDIVSGATIWGSCARAYNLAYANGTNPLCDLVDSAAPTVVICTLRVKTNGYADLTGTYCTGSVTPAAKCAAATGAVCNISKIYDQSGNANHLLQATAASQAILTFNALNGLPGMTTGGSTQMNTASTTLAFTQPWSQSSVYTRTANVADNTLLSGQSAGTLHGPSLTSGVFITFAGTRSAMVAASENAFHAAQSVFNSTSSVAAVDGTVVIGDAGTSNITATTMRMPRTSGGASLTGAIMETGIWPLGFNSTQYGAMNTNQHSAASGYNF